jgi:hypothetical protein
MSAFCMTMLCLKERSASPCVAVSNWSEQVTEPGSGVLQSVLTVCCLLCRPASLPPDCLQAQPGGHCA